MSQARSTARRRPHTALAFVLCLSGCTDASLQGRSGRPPGPSEDAAIDATEASVDAATVPPPPPRFAAPAFEQTFVLPESTAVKFPGLAACRGRFAAAGTANTNAASLWTFAASWTGDPASADLERRALLGATSGPADYDSASVACGPDGSLYVAWTEPTSNTVFLRRRDSKGELGTQQTVAAMNEMLFARVAVSQDGRVFVVWNGGERGATRYYYRTSMTGGESWEQATPTLLSAVAAQDVPAVTARGNRVAVAFVGDRGHLYAGRYVDGAFDIEEVTPKGPDDYNEGPGVAVGADDVLHVAYRNAPPSVVHAHRPWSGEKGAWTVEPLARPNPPTCANAVGTVAVAIDDVSNLHFAWAWRDKNALCYAFAKAGAPTPSPRMEQGALYLSSAALATVVDGTLTVVAATEEHDGANVQTRLFRFTASPEL